MRTDIHDKQQTSMQASKQSMVHALHVLRAHFFLPTHPSRSISRKGPNAREPPVADEIKMSTGSLASKNSATAFASQASHCFSDTFSGRVTPASARRVAAFYAQ